MMSREEALLKMLAVEDATHDEIVQATGWPVEETLATLQQLRQQRLVTHWNGAGRQWFRAGAPRRDGARTR